MGKSMMCALPPWAKRSTAGPPGYPARNMVPALSKASPMASSMVHASNCASPASSNANTCVCPPEATSPIPGMSSGGASSAAACTWASTWCTPSREFQATTPAPWPRLRLPAMNQSTQVHGLRQRHRGHAAGLPPHCMLYVPRARGAPSVRGLPILGQRPRTAHASHVATRPPTIARVGARQQSLRPSRRSWTQCQARGVHSRRVVNFLELCCMQCSMGCAGIRCLPGADDDAIGVAKHDFQAADFRVVGKCTKAHGRFNTAIG